MHPLRDNLLAGDRLADRQPKSTKYKPPFRMPSMALLIDNQPVFLWVSILWYSLLTTIRKPWCKMDTRPSIHQGSNSDSVGKAHIALAECLRSINSHTQAYFYTVIGLNNDFGRLSELLGVTDDEMMEILKFCGFCHARGGFFFCKV